MSSQPTTVVEGVQALDMSDLEGLIKVEHVDLEDGDADDTPDYVEDGRRYRIQRIVVEVTEIT